MLDGQRCMAQVGKVRSGRARQGGLKDQKIRKDGGSCSMRAVVLGRVQAYVCM